MREKDKRTAMAFGIMTKLNETKRQGIDGYYDCGKLGVLHLFWDRFGWNWKWIEISKEFIEVKK